MSSSKQGLSGQMPAFEEKMRSTDSDLRLMALIDLNKELVRLTAPSASTSSSTVPSSSSVKSNVYTDESTESTLVTMVLKSLQDSNAEVKNMSVTCLGAMSRRSRPAQMAIIVDELLAGIAAADEERRDISCLALKSVTVEMTTNVNQAPKSVESIITNVLDLLTKTTPDSQLASELLQILTDVYLRFSWAVTASAALQKVSIDSLIQIISSSRLSIRKRAIPSFSALLATDPNLFDAGLAEKIINGLSAKGDTASIWVGVVTSLARGSSAARIGGMISADNLVRILVKHLSDPEETEATEGALIALETLVLRCPTEVSPFIRDITRNAMDLVKYDPNFVASDEDDVDMIDDDEEEDGFDDEAYSDDEDVSWKIRRSAAKILFALIGTRNELLLDFYQEVAPLLVDRFNEREESVRLEVLAAYEVLLKQTSAARAAELASGARSKRKRSEGMDDDSASEDTATSRLRVALPQIATSLLKQLSSKSIPTRQQCFVLLRLLVENLDGGLEGLASQICAFAGLAARSVDSSTTSSLAIAALSFLAKFFGHHSARVYSPDLAELIPAIVRCMKDKIPRINFEAFAAASALAVAVRPKGSASPLADAFSQPIQRIFTATTEVLADTSVDSDVRERAMETLGSLLVHEGDILASSYSTCLPLINARLANENTAIAAVNVIGSVAGSAACGGPQFEQWLLEVIPEVIVTLRRSQRSTGKTAELSCLQVVLSRIGNNLPTALAEGIVAEMKAFIDSPASLHVIALVLRLQPACRSAVESMLPQVMEIIKVPTVNVHLAEALTALFAAYVEGDIDCATRLVPGLVNNLGKASSLPDATVGGTSIFSTTAQCIGAVAEHSQRNAAGIFATFVKTIKSPKATETDIYLALLCVGEIGRTSDLSGSNDLFQLVAGFFQNESEEVRSAAAFAIGNIAVGSPKTFLPALVKHIEAAQGSELLLLHALKEVILRTSSARLETQADILWRPLFPKKQTNGAGQGQTDDILGDDGIRNVKAACIGKLTTTAPAKFLPQLQELLHSSATDRALVAAAVRYTFIETSSSYDELIAPLIVDFLSLIKDDNLVVRRLSLASLNAALQNKPHLVVDRLALLQPLLLQETAIKKELQREVMMGPWKVIQDDGLENRKTAYETMYTMIGTCFTRVDLPSFTDRVLDALTDVNEIKVLALMLLLRLGQLSPTSVVPRLDDITPSLKAIMKDVEVKDDTVKQDLERKEEMQRSTLRTAVPLYRLSTAQQAPAFHSWIAGLLANNWKDYRDYQA